jgi:hypothetical protein
VSIELKKFAWWRKKMDLIPPTWRVGGLLKTAQWSNSYILITLHPELSYMANSITPGFRVKLNAHSMYVRNQIYTHTIYNIYTEYQCPNIYYLLRNNVLQKTKSITLWSIAVKRHHNSTGNLLLAIAHLGLYIVVLQIFFSFWAACLSRRKIARLNILMVDTQQVQE